MWTFANRWKSTEKENILKVKVSEYNFLTFFFMPYEQAIPYGKHNENREWLTWDLPDFQERHRPVEYVCCIYDCICFYLVSTVSTFKKQIFWLFSPLLTACATS